MDTTEIHHSLDGKSSVETVRQGLSYLNENAERILILFFYVFITFVIVFEVFRRFVLNFSSSWGSESAVFAYIYLTWIGASWAVKKRVHLRIGIIYRYVSERTKAYLYLLCDLVYLVVGFYAIYWFLPTIRSAIEFQRTTPGMQAPQAWFLFAIILGFTLFEIRSIQVLIKDLRTIIYGEQLYEGQGGIYGEEQ